MSGRATAVAVHAPREARGASTLTQEEAAPWSLCLASVPSTSTAGNCAGRVSYVPLAPKAFLVLMHLLVQRHRAVSKDELLATCWPSEFVTEAALTRCLRVIRQAVSDDGVRQHCIKTLHGYGYCFVAAVEERVPQAPDNPLSQVENPHRAATTVHTPDQRVSPLRSLLLASSPTSASRCAAPWQASANRS